MSRPDGTAGLTDGLTVTVVEAGAASRWRVVSDLADAGPEDAVYVVDPETATIRFGDGVHGRPLPAGASVEIGYRWGAGGTGLVDGARTAGTVVQVMPAVGWSVVELGTGGRRAVPLVGWALVDPGPSYRDGGESVAPASRTVRGLVVGTGGSVGLVDERAARFGGYRHG